MIKVDITKLTAEDMDELAAIESSFLRSYHPQALEIGYCGRIDGQIAGVGGVVRYWQGVGEVWAYYPRWALQGHKREVFAYTLQFLRAAAENYGFWRLQMVTKHPAAARFAEHLGFEAEGVLKAYNADKSDAVMWGRVCI